MGVLITIVFFGLTSGHLPLSPTARADSGALVSLYADGQKRFFPTDATTVAQVLKRADVKLQPGDLVEPSAETAVPTGQFNVNVYRSRPVLVVDGQRNYHLRSAYQSPRLLALAAGLTVYPEDDYLTEVVTNFTDNDGAIGTKVTIKRAKSITVKVDGTTRTLRTQATTVGTALQEAHIALGLQDTVSAPLDTPVTPGMNATVTRVSEVLATLTEQIPHATQTITDPTLPKGQTSIKNPGSNGSKTITYRIHYRDGLETGREAVQLVGQTNPTTRVVVVGTKVFFPGSVEHWRPEVEVAAAEWGLDPNMMLRIMNCESRGNATSVSAFIVNGEHPTGLFQYLPSTWRAAGGTDANILDGSIQIKLTARKMALYGTRAWQCQ